MLVNRTGEFFRDLPLPRLEVPSSPVIQGKTHSIIYGEKTVLYKDINPGAFNIGEKAFIRSVADSLRGGKTVLLDCGYFMEQDKKGGQYNLDPHKNLYELEHLRDGSWTRFSYAQDATRYIAREVLPFGENHFPTEGDFASRIKMSGSGVEFSSFMYVTYVLDERNYEPHLVIELQPLEVYAGVVEDYIADTDSDVTFVQSSGNILEDISQIGNLFRENKNVRFQFTEDETVHNVDLRKYDNAFYVIEMNFDFNDLQEEGYLMELVTSLIEANEKLVLKRKCNGFEEPNNLVIYRGENNTIKIFQTLMDDDYTPALLTLMQYFLSRENKIFLSFGTHEDIKPVDERIFMGNLEESVRNKCGLTVIVEPKSNVPKPTYAFSIVD